MASTSKKRFSDSDDTDRDPDFVFCSDLETSASDNENIIRHEVTSEACTKTLKTVANPSECLNNDSVSSSIDKRKSEKKTKKRPRNPEKWARNVSKRLKAEGKPYMGLKNKVKTLKHERITGLPCNCKYRCFNMITNKVKLQVLKMFNELGNKEKQDVFLGGANPC